MEYLNITASNDETVPIKKESFCTLSKYIQEEITIRTSTGEELSNEDISNLVPKIDNNLLTIIKSFCETEKRDETFFDNVDSKLILSLLMASEKLQMLELTDVCACRVLTIVKLHQEPFKIRKALGIHPENLQPAQDMNSIEDIVSFLQSNGYHIASATILGEGIDQENSITHKKKMTLDEAKDYVYHICDMNDEEYKKIDTEVFVKPVEST